ncbi:MAG TPA: CRISPR-associated endonuclease Cas2 [Lachnospiraceae bacterium]|nr:CRISPR-associated endonuclease Cas2 [Lachnospiraceae bacterium]
MENYFWNTEENIQNDKKLYVLIIYDIVDNKKRTRFAKMMNGYGFRVQKSAFEAMISQKLYKKLLDEIPKYMNPKEDSVRVYKMQGRGEVKIYGVNASPVVEDVIIL